MIATDSYDGIKIWDAKTGLLAKSFEKTPEPILKLAFPPGGQGLVSGGGKVLRIWDLKTGRSVKTITLPTKYLVTSIAASPDGKSIAVSTGDDLRLYSANTLALVRSFERKQGDAYHALSFTRNGQL